LHNEKGTNKKIKAHYGFYSSYLLAREFIHNIVKSTNKEIIFHGHSKGGALATLAALDTQYNFNKDVGIFVAGCPAIGNKCFVDSLIKRLPDYHRYSFGNDIVSVLPPELFFYYHAGPEYHTGPERKWYKMNMNDHHWQNYYNLFENLTK